MDKASIWQNISYVNSSKYRLNILKQLDKPCTPSTLSKETDIHLSHVSRTLSELLEKKLIECLAPDSLKSKYYEISEDGKKILKEIEEIQ